MFSSSSCTGTIASAQAPVEHIVECLQLIVQDSGTASPPIPLGTPVTVASPAALMGIIMHESGLSVTYGTSAGTFTSNCRHNLISMDIFERLLVFPDLTEAEKLSEDKAGVIARKLAHGAFVRHLSVNFGQF